MAGSEEQAAAEYSDTEISLMSEEEREALDLSTDNDDGGETSDQSDDQSATADEKNEDTTATAEQQQSTADSNAGGQQQEGGQAQTESQTAQFLNENATDQGQEESGQSAAGEQQAQESASITRINAIDEEMKVLREKFNDGDIDFNEYTEQVTTLNNERQEQVAQSVREDVKKEVVSEIAAQKNREAQEDLTRTWEQSRDGFLAKEENKLIQDNPIVTRAFAASLESVVQSDEAKGRDFNWMLNKARDELVALNILKGSSTTQKKDNLSTVDMPKTLGDIPAAEANSTGSQYGHLDKLDEESGLDEILAKMSPEESERYLAGL